ncbi:MAG: hypothetical protein AB7I37_04995 [Pirellulales bacterium]
MKSRSFAMLLALLSVTVAGPSIAESPPVPTPALQPARADFDRFLQDLQDRLTATKAANDEALAAAANLPDGERQLSLLEAGRRTRQTLGHVRQQVREIPRIELLRLRPQAAQEVAAIIEQIESAIESSSLRPEALTEEARRSRTRDSQPSSSTITFRYQSDDEQPEDEGGEEPEDSGHEGEPADATDRKLTRNIQQGQDLIEQTQAMLNQLRRLQDLQVAVEPRFIAVTDDFYDRLGVDFNLNANNNVDGPVDYEIRVQVDGIVVTGGALNPGYDGGVGTKCFLDIPFGYLHDRVVVSGQIGFQHQTWFSQGINVNTPGQNFALNGNGNAYGGTLGLGFETVPVRVHGLPVFLLASATLGMGGMEQGLTPSAFNPALPILTVNSNNPAENAFYLNGVFSGGIGVRGRLGSLELIGSFQNQGSGLLVNNWRGTGSAQVGLAITTDIEAFFLLAARRGNTR